MRAFIIAILFSLFLLPVVDARLVEFVLQTPNTHILADTMTYENDPNSNFGSYTNVNVGGLSDWEYYTWLKVNASIGNFDKVHNASFCLWVYGQSGPQARVVNLYKSDNITWTESYPTWNNQGSIGYNSTVIDTVTSSDINHWNCWNVTKIVEPNKVVTFRLEEVSEYARSENYWSKEYTTNTTRRPKLIVFATVECGDGICHTEYEETQENCCQDCGCPSGLECIGECKVGGTFRTLFPFFVIFTVLAFVYFSANKLLSIEFPEYRKEFGVEANVYLTFTVVGVLITIIIILTMLAMMIQAF